MLFHSLFLLSLLTCVLTTQTYDRDFKENLHDVIPSWPSIYLTKGTIQKRQAEPSLPKSSQNETTPLNVNLTNAKTLMLTEKGVLEHVSEGNVELPVVPLLDLKPITKPPADNSSNVTTTLKTISSTGNTTTHNQNGTVGNSTVIQNIEKATNGSDPAAKPAYHPDLNNPGVMKRGLIVFGAFALMAVAYFVFYRRKGKNNNLNNTHGASDTNQFRYGVLQSDDRRDNLELSRMPLTMESEEDEDEDLDLFDLEQKKKSLSYVNLQASDDYLVHGSTEDRRDRDNLLLDIEDANSDTLINWSSNGNKSIL